MRYEFQDLVFRAGGKLYSEPPMRQVTGIVMTFDQIQTFAEMIVRECAEVALTEDHDPSDCILSHFGVELHHEETKPR